MKLATCKKLNLPNYQQKRIKENRDLRIKKIVAKTNLKSRFLFFPKFSSDFYSSLIEDFEPEMYLKKGIPNDTIEIDEEDGDLRAISLLKDVLQKMIINVGSNVSIKIWAADDFYALEDFNLEYEIDQLLEDPDYLERTIYTALEDVYMPKNKNLFYNIDAAKEKIKYLSNDDVSYKLYVLLFSFSLFFLDRLHDYFLDALKENERIIIEMGGINISASESYYIHFYPFQIPEEHFFYDTRIILDDDTINVDEKITEIIKQFVDYVNTITGKKYKDYELENSILYNIGVKSFFAYMLTYLYHIIDVERLLSNFIYLESLQLEIRADTNYAIVTNAPEYVLPKESAVPKGSLLDNIVTKKVKIKADNGYLFYTEDNRFIFQDGGANEKLSMIEFLQKNKERGENITSFLLFTPSIEGEDRKYYFQLIFPASTEGILLFYKLFYSSGDLSIDSIYKLAHESLHKHYTT